MPRYVIVQGARVILSHRPWDVKMYVHVWIHHTQCWWMSGYDTRHGMSQCMRMYVLLCHVNWYVTLYAHIWICWCSYLTVQHKTNTFQNSTSPKRSITNSTSTKQCNYIHNDGITKQYQPNKTVIKRYSCKTVQLLSGSQDRQNRTGRNGEAE